MTVTAATADQGVNWDEIWKAQKTGWDAGRSSPALVSLLQEEERYCSNSTQFKTALVPGCGTGYDLVTLATHVKGLQTVHGIDLSETAVNVARKFVAENRTSDLPVVVEAFQADFFKLPSTATCTYDLIFDYTFFCALPPSMRQQWAETYAQLLTPESGELICLEFPLDKAADERERGPPFLVSHEAYAQVLEPLGFECVMYRGPTEVKGHEARQGKESLAVWRLKK